MVAKKATAGSGRRGSRIRTKQGAATNKEPLVKKAVRTAAKATTTRKPAPAAPKTAATARKTAGSRQDSKIAVAHRDNDGNASLRIIDPAEREAESSSDMKSISSGYVYGPDSGRGFDDVVFDSGRKVFLSETQSSVNPGDPVIVQLAERHCPIRHAR